jgi:predicted metal-binding protein
MTNNNLEQYCQQAKTNGVTDAIVTKPSLIITAPWVRLKCQFGCGGYGKSYCCPPHAPTPQQTREILDSFNRAIFFHFKCEKGIENGGAREKYLKTVADMEQTLFLDGYYRTFCFLEGPCVLCKQCSLLENKACNFPRKARPSMEACGIDVFQTAKNHGFPIHTLREKTETQNLYCLMLVD